MSSRVTAHRGRTPRIHPPRDSDAPGQRPCARYRACAGSSVARGGAVLASAPHGAAKTEVPGIPATRGPWQDGHELIARTELPGNSLTSETSSYQGSIFPKSRQHGLGVLQDAALLGKVPLHPSSGPIADLCSERFSTCWTNATVGLPSDTHTFCRGYAAAPFVEATTGPCLHNEVAFL